MKNLIERLWEESLYSDKCTLEIMDLCMEAAEEMERLQTENVKLIAANKAATLDKEFLHRLLRDELEQVKTERDELIRRNQSAYEIAWGCDIPSPTVPEYIELHEGMTKVMNALRDQKE